MFAGWSVRACDGHLGVCPQRQGDIELLPPGRGEGAGSEEVALASEPAANGNGILVELPRVGERTVVAGRPQSGSRRHGGEVGLFAGAPSGGVWGVPEEPDHADVIERRDPVLTECSSAVINAA